ncbi:MAG: DUF2855 family protein [Polyangiales bacterium]
MSLAPTTRLLSSKAQLQQSRIDRRAEPPLEDGEAMLALDRVALTTNNITYAVFGEAMQYWQFFPTGEPGWGQMPVWGFANVVASRSPGIEVGERYYGYYPLASQLRMRPERNSQRGFYDGTPHRAALVSAYNQYTRCTTDPSYEARFEDHQALLRPLLITAFFAADFLIDNDLFGARRVLVSSASSKTAYGTAYCLRRMRDVELVALTSASNRRFVEELGCYQRVVGYDALETLERDVPTVYLDYSGDITLRGRVHEQLGAALVYDCVAGSAQNADPSHLQAPAGVGPAPKLYFAPTQIKKRTLEWGHDEVNKRVADAQRAFILRVADPERPWLNVVEHAGLDAAAALIVDFVRGRVDPRAGHIISMSRG